MKLYYYTGPEFLRDILQKKRVKVSRYGRFGSLNDPFEQAPFDTSDQEFRKRLKQIIDELAQNLGLICLSKTRYSPAMWAHYADNHTGACLEFEVTFDNLIRIEYETKKLFQGISSATFRDKVNMGNIREILTAKSKDWSYEKEHRLHVPLDNEVVIKEGKHYFMPFQEKQAETFMLKRVFVGYRCSKGISNITHDVKGYLQKVEVTQTRPSFSCFKVVNQRDKKFWNFEEGEKGKENSLPAVQAVFGH